MNARALRLLLSGALFAALLAAAGFGAYWLGVRLSPPPPLAGTMLQNPALVGENTLLRENGERVTLLEVMGDAQLMLVFFGFTRCPDVCPITMARLAKIKHDTDAMDGVRMVMITVDPEHDTPDVMARYVQGFHPDFVGLSGSNSDIATTARSFYVGYADLGGGQWTHTEAVAVVDRQGRLRYVYGNDKVPQLEIDLPQLKRAL